MAIKQVIRGDIADFDLEITLTGRVLNGNAKKILVKVATDKSENADPEIPLDISVFALEEIANEGVNISGWFYFFSRWLHVRRMYASISDLLQKPIEVSFVFTTNTKPDPL